MWFSFLSLEYIFKKCISETVDIYNGNNYRLYYERKIEIEEKLCEIISKLNAHDLLLLKKIKYSINEGEHVKYKEEMERIKKNI